MTDVWHSKVKQQSEDWQYCDITTDLSKLTLVLLIVARSNWPRPVPRKIAKASRAKLPKRWHFPTPPNCRLAPVDRSNGGVRVEIDDWSNDTSLAGVSKLSLYRG
jgi:hypothetical protein